GVYTFKINDDYSLTYMNFVNFSNHPTRGILRSTDEKMLIAGTDSSIVILNFNETTGRYEKTSEIIMANTGIGLDMNNNIWVVELQWALHLYNNEIPTTIKIKFKDRKLKYEGEELASALVIDAFNYNGERLELDLELTLKGNAKFENDNKVMKTKTS